MFCYVIHFTNEYVNLSVVTFYSGISFQVIVVSALVFSVLIHLTEVFVHFISIYE